MKWIFISHFAKLKWRQHCFLNKSSNIWLANKSTYTVHPGHKYLYLYFVFHIFRVFVFVFKYFSKYLIPSLSQRVLKLNQWTRFLGTWNCEHCLIPTLTSQSSLLALSTREGMIQGAGVSISHQWYHDTMHDTLILLLIEHFYDKQWCNLLKNITMFLSYHFQQKCHFKNHRTF